METVAARIYAEVRERIIDGRLPPGSRVTEQQVAGEFDTSRTPVREAMRLLAADGFVLFKPNSGTVVREWTAGQIHDIFQLRLLVEGEIAGQVAAHIAASAIDELEAVQDEIEARGPDTRAANAARVGTLNRRFHRIVADACRNEQLTGVLASAIAMPVVQQTFRRYSPRELSRSFAHHRELIDALRAGDGDWARSVMRCHIHAARQTLLGGSKP